MDTTASRAAKMVKGNRFLTLATASGSGAWAAPVNYIVGPGAYLHYYSARSARHSRDIEATATVAGAIFNSQAASEDVDGMQFEAVCTALQDQDLSNVHEYYFDTNFSAEERDWWFRPTSAFDKGGTWAFYRIDMRHVWVIDFESIERERLDTRLEVNIDEMWKQLSAMDQ